MIYQQQIQPYQQPQPVPYPASAPQPLFWQGVMAAVVNIVILVALGSWAFSQVKKAVKGEEVQRPF